MLSLEKRRVDGKYDALSFALQCLHSFMANDLAKHFFLFLILNFDAMPFTEKGSPGFEKAEFN